MFPNDKYDLLRVRDMNFSFVNGAGASRPSSGINTKVVAGQNETDSTWNFVKANISLVSQKIKKNIKKEKEKLFYKIQNGSELSDIKEWLHSLDLEELTECDIEEYVENIEPLYKLQNWSYDDVLSDTSSEGITSLRALASESFGKVNFLSRWTGGKSFDKILSLIESVVLFIEDIMLTTDTNYKVHVPFCVARLMRMNGISLCTSAVRGGGKLIRQIVDLFEFGIEIQSENSYLEWLRKFVEGKEIIEHSLFMKKTKMMLARILALGLFPMWKINITQYFPEICKCIDEMEQRPLVGGMDFVFSLCDYVVFCGTKGYDAITLGVWNAFFNEKNSISDWVEQVSKLKLKSNFFSDPQVLVLAGYVTDTIDITIINSECSELLDKGKAFMANKRFLHKREYEVLERSIRDLELIRVSLTSTRFTMRSRPMPFGMVLHGRSAVLKSYLTQLFYKTFAQAANSIQWENKPNLNLVADDEHFYSRNANDAYWSKFKSNMWCINFDDVGGTKPAVAQGVPTDIASFLRVQNNTPYVTEQADVEDKGRIPIQNLLTIGSTNVFNLDVPMYMNDSYANLRRFHLFIDVGIKDEYTSNGETVDVDKIPHDQEILDIWNFRVKTVEPEYINKLDQRVNVSVKFKTLHCFDNIDDMLSFYCKAVVKHLKTQERALCQSQKTSEVKLCATCFRRTCVCEQELQSDKELVTCIKSITLTTCYALLRVLFLIITCAWNILCNKSDIRKPVYDKWIIQFLRCRLYMRNCLRRFKYKYTWLKILGIFSSLLILVSFLLKLKKKTNVQGNTGSIPIPVGKVDEEVNVWHNDNLELSNFDITPNMSSWTGKTLDSFCDYIGKNTFYVNFKDDKGDFRKGRMLAVGGQVYVTNNHYFVLDKIVGVTIFRGKNSEGITASRYESIDISQLYAMPDQDLIFVYLPNQPPAKNISKYFLDVIQKKHFLGAGLVRNEDYTLETRALTSGWHEANILVADKEAPQINRQFDLYFSRANGSYAGGECGSPLIMEIAHSGFCIAGIHMLTRRSFRTDFGSAPILREWVECALTYFGPQTEPSPVLLNSSSAPHVEIKALHPKSPLNWIYAGNCEVYGSIQARCISTSKVVPTAICNDIVEATINTNYPIKANYGPPVMGRDWRPKRIALLDCTNTNTSMSNHILERCVEAYWKDIQRDLPEDEWDLIQEYDLFTAINGANGVKYVDKMNRNTSAGFPWCTSKRKFLINMPETNGLQEPVDIDAEIKARVILMDERVRAGKRAMPIFNAQMKDEPVSKKKQESGKTRVFSSAPMDFSIVMRKYFLSCVRVIQRNIFVFEAAPGVNAHSTEWRTIYDYLVKHSKERIIAGDYSAFDKTMPPIVIKKAFRILYMMCQRAGYSDEALRAVASLSEDIAFPITNFFGDMVQFNGSNPSGHPLTVIINSIANSLYMRYAYYLLNPANECGSFRSYVALITYGDDNICGVSPLCDFFTHTGIQAALHTCGIRYTMADKEAKSVPFISIEQASFLKREFYFSSDFDNIVAKLDHDSLSKMLTSCVKSKGLTLKQHSMEVMRCALTEYAFYGKTVFQERQIIFKMLWHTHRMYEITDFDKYMPTWNQIFCRFWKIDDSNSLTTIPLEEEVDA